MTSKLWIYAGTIAAASACISSPESAPDVDTAAESLAAAGMERLIPIRITALRDCVPGPCAVTVSLADVNASIEVANRIYAAAGVQFYLERLDRVEAPYLEANWYSTDDFTFARVKQELALVFPQMPLDAYADNTAKEIGMWMHAVQAIYEDNRRLHIWVTAGGGSKSSAELPQRGRGIRMLPGHFSDSRRSTMAHEIGHFLGLPHTFQYYGDALDPETGAPWKRSDRWDLMYKRGTSASDPHVFYSSRAAAAVDEDKLELIEFVIPDGGTDSDTNCDTDWDTLDIPGYPVGTVRCAVGIDKPYWEWKYTGDAALKGLARTYPDGSRGKNLMSYERGPGGDDVPAFLSDSQIAMIKKNLRWDIAYDADREAEFLDGYQGTPTNMGGRRPRLGSARAAEPAPKLDFDNDGKRDIAYWIAPMTPAGVGEFRVLLSSNSFSAASGQYMHVMLGRAGDIPVPADYNGDGRTDVAVYQGGGGLNRDNAADTYSWWRYCATNTNSAASTVCPSADGVPIQFGQRQDAPQFGHDFDGVAGDELAIYRAETGRFYVRNASGTFSFNRALGVAKGGVVPLVGLYGCDSAADLAVYEPSTARFKLLDSADDWDTPITHQFDTEFVPYPSGAGEDRAAPIALSGMVSRKACSAVGGTIQFRSRRAAALFYPAGGQWNLIWNPTSTSATIDQCSFGNGATDLPLAGLDRNGDGRSDMALIRPATSWGGDGYIITRHTVAGACSGTTAASRTCTDCGPSARGWVTPDVTGDSLNDIQVIDHHATKLRRYRSQDDFAVSTQTTLPSINLQML